MTAYVALTLISVLKTGELVQPGSRVDLSHLTPDERLLLEDMTPPVIRLADDEQRPAEDGQEA
jgi:hypothetical protein